APRRGRMPPGPAPRAAADRSDHRQGQVGATGGHVRRADAVAAAALGFVEQAIGFGEQLIERLPRLRDGDADADGDRYVHVARPARPVRDAMAQTLGSDEAVGRAIERNEKAELLAAI